MAEKQEGEFGTGIELRVAARRAKLLKSHRRMRLREGIGLRVVDCGGGRRSWGRERRKRIRVDREIQTYKYPFDCKVSGLKLYQCCRINKQQSSTEMSLT